MTIQQLADLSIGKGEKVNISALNIDDVFCEAMRYGIRELSVTSVQMAMIVLFYLTYVKADPKGNQANVVKEGRVDRFMGVALKINKSI